MVGKGNDIETGAAKEENKRCDLSWGGGDLITLTVENHSEIICYILASFKIT